MAVKPYIRCTTCALVGALLWTATTLAQAPANASHTHIAHIMTSWTDTPGMKGFLPTAIADAQVAMEEVERADLEGRINDFWLYGGYVLNALDPGAETNALLKTAYARLPTNYVKIEVPGTGYGIKRAVAGALQHVQLAAKSDGASDNVKTHAAHVIASLENVAKWTRRSDRHRAQASRGQGCRRRASARRRTDGPDRSDCHRHRRQRRRTNGMANG